MKTKPHEHRWVAIRPGFPQKICKCGHMKVGTHTVLLSDSVRYTTTKAAATLGEIGMDVTTGRPSGFIGGVNSPLAASADVSSQIVQATNSIGFPLSSSFVLLTSMTITPAAGTYLVWGSFQGSNTGSDQDLGAQIAINGTGIVESTRSEEFAVGVLALSAMARVTVNGAEAIQLLGRGGGLSASYSIRQLMISKTG